MKRVRISGSANNEIYVVFAVMKKCGRMKSDLVCRIKKANKILGRAKWELVPGPTALTLVFNLIDVSWGRPPFNDHPNHSYRDALRNIASSTYPRCNFEENESVFFLHFSCWVFKYFADEQIFNTSSSMLFSHRDRNHSRTIVITKFSTNNWK